MTRIVVDAMGGDNAPDAIVEGCVLAVEALRDVEIALVGQQPLLEEKLAGRTQRIEIVHAPDVITNHDSPAQAVRRRTESSLVVGMEMVKRGDAQGFVSAGSTGAVLTGGIFRVGRIRGIQRPALAPLLPTATGRPVMLIDCGANVDCKPEYLAQFGLMGAAYMERVIGVPGTRAHVALVNIGAEAEKGNELVKAAFPLLEAQPIDFIGNIEARDLLSGDADVLVADGFAGNLILKYTEGLAATLMDMLKEQFMADTRSKLGAALAKPALRRFKRKMDYSEYGGAPLLGVNGALVKAHGSSNARAMRYAIEQAAKMVSQGVVSSIRDVLERAEQTNPMGTE